MKRIFTFVAIGVAGFIQSCTQSHGQTQVSIQDVVSIRHAAFNHNEVKKRISTAYSMGYKIENSITSCYNQDCLTTLVFASR
ncbi:hypothetical protein GCM10027299_43890 [Larkinella ripae]